MKYMLINIFLILLIASVTLPGWAYANSATQKNTGDLQDNQTSSPIWGSGDTKIGLSIGAGVGSGISAAAGTYYGLYNRYKNVQPVRLFYYDGNNRAVREFLQGELMVSGPPPAVKTGYKHVEIINSQGVTEKIWYEEHTSESLTIEPSTIRVSTAVTFVIVMILVASVMYLWLTES